MSATDEDMAVMERAAQILHDEPSCTGRRALIQARHELAEERVLATQKPDVRITWLSSGDDRPNAIGLVYVGEKVVAGAVVLNNDGTQWILTSNLPAKPVTGARVTTLAAAEMWLHFLADLYTGVYR